MKNLVYSVLEECILRFRPLGEDITLLKTQIRSEISQNWRFQAFFVQFQLISLIFALEMLLNQL